MSRPARKLHQRLTAREDEPLFAIPIIEDGEEVVHYFTSEEEFERAFPRDEEAIRKALSLAGAWEHLDAEDGPDILDELDRMRHESKPSPPLEL
jgi:hypothetical protein